jgi:hypothetical protein
MYLWIVNTARIVLILTEATVILALVIRVVVDVQSKDLDTRIKTFDNMLKLREPEEKKYLLLQNKITTYQTAYDSLPVFSNVIKTINENIPMEIVNVNITIGKDSISVTGESQNTYIQQFEEFLKNSPMFSDSQLTTFNVEGTKEEVKISKFTFTSKIKNLELRKLIPDNL